MARTRLDNGRRVVIFERFCVGIRELPARDRLAFFDALLEYGTTGTMPEVGTGFAKMVLPEVVAVSQASDANAVRMRSHRANEVRTKCERNANEVRTNDARNPAQEKEKEKEYKTTSSTVQSSSSRSKSIPTLSTVLDHVEVMGWAGRMGCSVEQAKDLARQAFEQATFAGWTDSDGRRVGNWRTYLYKIASEKKISEARAALAPECCLGSTEEG